MVIKFGEEAQVGEIVFGADAEGWRLMNSGRPAHELIREAVQNAFDEVGCTALDVEITYEDNAVYFSITDDVPGGIRNERLIWMIWLSDKTDAPTKRGRMGRGLKELISVADWSLIVTEGGPAVEFKRYRASWTRTSPKKKRPKSGTVIEGRVKIWNKSDVASIVEYLRRVRPPEGVVFTVNGQIVERDGAAETYKLTLPTVVFEMVEGERRQREPRRETEVELIAEAISWVYEMGIPIEKIDYPHSIDIHQRVPLREKRDTLTQPYRRELMAKLLDARSQAGLVDHAQMRDNHALLAAEAPEHLSERTKKDMAHAWTNGMPYAATPAVVRTATGQHLPVAPLRALPESMRAIVREVGTDAKQILDERATAACHPLRESEQDPAQIRLRRTWSWIAAGIHRTCRVVLAEGTPSAVASFHRETRTLTVFVENAPGCVADPLCGASLSILIHELAHWRSQENEHGMNFHSDAETVGGDVAAFLLAHADEALQMAELV